MVSLAAIFKLEKDGFTPRLFLCPKYKNNGRFLDTQKTIYLSPFKHLLTHSNNLNKIDPIVLSFFVINLSQL